MNTNETSAMYIGSNEVQRVYNGDVLVWEKDVHPVGRTINVGSGSGMLTIDGANLTYEGSPTSAQEGDVIVIAPGTYQSTQWPLGAINIQNFNLSAGFCRITCGGPVSIDGEVHFLGVNPQRGVHLDFDGAVEFITNYPELIRIDEPQVGGYERIKISNFSITMQVGINYLIRHYCNSIMYPDVAIKDLEVYNIDINGDCYNPIVIGNSNEEIDSGYCEDVNIHDINIVGPNSAGTVIKLGNTEGFEIHDIIGDQVNMPEDTAHGRFIYAFGRGDIYNVGIKESGGAAAVISMFSRFPDQVCRIFNVFSYNGHRYSAAEFRSYSSFHVLGQTYKCAGEGDFVSFYTNHDSAGYGCTAFDLYDNVSTDYQLRNSVAVNPQSGGLGSIWQGSSIKAPVVSFNVIESDNSDTLLSSDMVPGIGSVLTGSGVNVPGIHKDATGVVRSNPPTIGAIEG